jgi:hypothetical protein
VTVGWRVVDHVSPCHLRPPVLPRWNTLGIVGRGWEGASHCLLWDRSPHNAQQFQTRNANGVIQSPSQPMAFPPARQGLPRRDRIRSHLGRQRQLRGRGGHEGIVIAGETVKDEGKFADYRAAVPATSTPGPQFDGLTLYSRCSEPGYCVSFRSGSTGSILRRSGVVERLDRRPVDSGYRRERRAPGYGDLAFLVHV